MPDRCIITLAVTVFIGRYRLEFGLTTSCMLQADASSPADRNEETDIAALQYITSHSCCTVPRSRIVLPFCSPLPILIGFSNRTNIPDLHILKKAACVYPLWWTQIRMPVPLPAAGGLRLQSQRLCLSLVRNHFWDKSLLDSVS